MVRIVKQLADLVGGEPAGLVETPISRLTPIDDSTEDSIAPLLRKNVLIEGQILPGAVLTTPELNQFALESKIPATIVHSQPTSALKALIDLFFPMEKREPIVHPSAVIDEAANIHPTASIGPLAVIESQVTIGEGSVVGPRAIILQGSVIGKRVTIGPGAIIGSDGFGYALTEQGPSKIRHVGNVVVEDDVDIGANTCIDRATLGTTLVGRCSKLDNLVQVGHNVRIGEGVFVAGQVGLAGSTTIGDGAMLGGQAGIADHLEVGSGAKVAAKSGVTKNIENNETVGGYPAISRSKWLRATAWLLQNSSREEDPDTEDK